MTALHELPFLGFDLETTGINAREDRIVTAALVREVPTKTPHHWDWLINPGIDIPEAATAVHGITTEHARLGLDPAEVLDELTGLLTKWMAHGLPVVAMNASYDLTMLEAENTRHGVTTLAARLAPNPVGPVIDPFVLDKKVDTYRRGGRKLVDLATHYGVTLSNAHTAGADAYAGLQVAREILAANPSLHRLSVGGLHHAQVAWRAEQMTSLRRYFDRKGTEHDGCCGGWPVHGGCCAPATPARDLERALW